MSLQNRQENMVYLEKFTSRKEITPFPFGLEQNPDSISFWIDKYLNLAIKGVRSEEVTNKITMRYPRCFLHGPWKRFYFKTHGAG